MSNKTQLVAQRDELEEYAGEVLLARQVSAWRQALAICVEGTINSTDPILSSGDIARETGWGETGYISMPSDRARGAYYPFFRSEQELAHIRAIGRNIAVADPMGKSVVKNVTNYTDGEGFNYQLHPKDKTDQAATMLCEQAQQMLDKFLEANDIIGRRERELIEEAMPAGEALVCLKASDDGIPRVRIRSTDHLREPPDSHKLEEYYSLPSGLDWSFGVAAPMDDAEDVKGYFCWWYGMADNWEFLPESRCELVKLNVPGDVKRGLSEFFVSYKDIQQVASGIFACGEGAKIQAAIAGVEKIPPGIPVAAVENMTQTPGSFVAQVNGRKGARNIRLNPFTSATIITTDHDWQNGMLGQPQGPTLIEVFAAVARRVGSAYSMPEWMISGDASNNNQASSITAGSGFDVAMQGNQGMWSKVWTRICWKALAMMGLDTEALKQSVTLEVKGNQVASREEETDEKVRVMRLEAGVLSKRTYSTEVGLDYDEEQQNIAAEPAPPLAIAAAGLDGKFSLTQASDLQQAAQTGGTPPAAPMSTQPTYEQLVFSTLDRLAAKAIYVEPIAPKLLAAPVKVTAQITEEELGEFAMSSPQAIYEQFDRLGVEFPNELDKRLKAIEMYKSLSGKEVDPADLFIKETDRQTGQRIQEQREQESLERDQRMEEMVTETVDRITDKLPTLIESVHRSLEYDIEIERGEDGIATKLIRVPKNVA